MRFLFWVEDPNFVGYVFRKNATDLKGGGGAFREAVKMFTAYDKRVKYTKQPMCIYFPSGATINFTGLDGEAGMNAIQGIQISAAMLDEATHFSEEEVMWIISRLRTSADMSPCLWLTCNPDYHSFLCRWLEPYHLYPRGTYINDELVEGRPKPEADGVTRYYLRVGNEMVWGDTDQELIDKYKHMYPKNSDGSSTCKPRSFKFISATCLDNPPLLEANPDYVSSLASLPRVTKERLLMGNWYALEEESGYFKRDWVSLVDYPEPIKVKRWIRAFDIAYSVPSEQTPYPDYTAAVLMAKTVDDMYIVCHVDRVQMRAGEVEDWVLSLIQEDRKYCIGNYQAYLPQDPAAGQMVRIHWAKLGIARGIPLRFHKVTSQNGKLGSFQPFSAASENSLVAFVKDKEWNDYTFSELEAFDGKRSTHSKKDDICDGLSLAFNILATSKELPKISANKIRMVR